MVIINYVLIVHVPFETSPTCRTPSLLSQNLNLNLSINSTLPRLPQIPIINHGQFQCVEDGVLLNTPALAHVFWSMLPEDSRGPTQLIYHLLCATHNKPYHAAHCHRGCLRGELVLVNIALKLKSWNKFSLSKISEIWVDFSSQVWMNLKMNKYLQNAKYFLVPLTCILHGLFSLASWIMVYVGIDLTELSWLNFPKAHISCLGIM